MFETLISPVTLADFEAQYWECQPLLVTREELPADFSDLLQASDLPMLSKRMAALGIKPQIMRDGVTSEPHELLQDFLDGGSAIINRIDRVWPSIGRLCASLRAVFMHVFAVMYLTPRDSRAVPPHTDDQDVFILQLAGTKIWKIYGSPIELPYSSEQLGKFEPIPASLWETELREPQITTELKPGSVLYLPRGCVHEARATSEESSLHITLTVQTSDLNWHTFMRDGLMELHRRSDIARRALPLDRSLGGWGAPGSAIFDPTFEAARCTAAGAGSGSSSGVDTCPAAAATSADCGSADSTLTASAASYRNTLSAASHRNTLSELMDWTASCPDDGFDAAISVLERKLERLNGAQDRAIAEAEADLARFSNAALPQELAAIPDIEMICLGGGVLECYDGERDATMRCRLGSIPQCALELITSRAERAQTFSPVELPSIDSIEQVAVCARLLKLGVLCNASMTDPYESTR